ncbi:hypothetical protein [Luteolibacter sp. LG18]|uniref:hypothetical protein n=1 Tax=Luteolibacter sp. LG18 TaxID=2819286 RepID=UPI002B2D7880|nr:hypothetical protein llg_11420 [Luteolibacter sp. LG18]
MSPAERFLAVFTKGFSDDRESVLTLEHHLKGPLDGMDPQELEDMTGRLEKAGRKPRWWRPLLWTSFAAAVAAVAWEGMFLQNGPVRAMVWSGSFDESYPFFAPVLTLPSTVSIEDYDRLRQEQFTNPPKPADRGSSTPEGHTNRPAAYLNGLRDRMGRSETIHRPDWPSDFLATGETLDPTNAWFPLVEAKVKLSQSLSRASCTDPKILDPVKFDEGMALLHLAAQKSACRTYSNSLLKSWSSRIKPPRTAWDRMLGFPRSNKMQEETELGYFIALAMRAKSYELAQTRDRSGLVSLIADWKAICRHLTNTPDYFWEGDDCIEAVIDGGERLAQRRLFPLERELTDEVQRTLDSPALQALKRSAPRSQWADVDTGVFSQRLAESRVMHAVPEEAFVPSQRLDHAIFDRAQAWNGMWITLVVIGLLGIMIRSRSTMARRGSLPLSALLRLNDHAWIAMIGIVFPLLLYIGISRFTPLGCRDHGTRWLQGFPFGVQAFGSVLLAIALTLESSAWRLERRLPFLATARPGIHPWQAIVPFLCMVIVIGVGSVRYVNARDVDKLFEHGLAYAVALGIPALALLGRFADLAYLSPGAAGLLRLGTLRVTFTALFGLLLALFATIPLSSRAERYWITHDPLFDRDPNHLGLGKAHHDAMIDLKARLIEALDTK